MSADDILGLIMDIKLNKRINKYILLTVVAAGIFLLCLLCICHLKEPTQNESLKYLNNCKKTLEEFARGESHDKISNSDDITVIYINGLPEIAFLTFLNEKGIVSDHHIMYVWQGEEVKHCVKRYYFYENIIEGIRYEAGTDIWPFYYFSDLPGCFIKRNLLSGQYYSRQTRRMLIGELNEARKAEFQKWQLIELNKLKSNHVIIMKKMGYKFVKE